MGVAHEWYSSFNNFFTLLDSRNFTRDQENPLSYVLDCNDNLLLPVYRSIADNIYGDFNSFVVDSFVLHTDGEKIIGYEGTFAPLVSTSFVLTTTVEFEGKVTKIGEDSFESPKPIEGTEDADFVATMSELREGNYEVVSKEHSEGWSDTTTYYSGASDGGTYVTQNKYESNKEMTAENLRGEYLFHGYVDDWNSPKTQRLAKIGDDYYYSMSKVTSSLKDTMLPKFNLSSLFFEKINGVYKLKSELPWYTVLGNAGQYSVFLSTNIGSLDITVSENEVVFDTVYETSWSKIEEQTTYTNIGKVTGLAPSEEKVHETTDAFTKIEDYFYSESDKTKTVEVLTSKVLNYIPTPGGNVSEVVPTVDVGSSSTEVQVRFMLDAYGDYGVQYDDMLVRTSESLGANGFVFDPTNTWVYSFDKVETINGTEQNVNISFGLSGNIFAVDFELTAATATE